MVIDMNRMGITHAGEGGGEWPRPWCKQISPGPL